MPSLCKSFIFAWGVVIYVFTPTVAVSAIISTGDLDYDDHAKMITNRVNGQSYLGWGVLASLTYAETVSITSAGAAYDDYHIASQTEAYAFFEAAAGQYAMTVIGQQVTAPLAQWYNATNLFGFSDMSDPNYSRAFFLSDAHSPVGLLSLSDTGLTFLPGWEQIEFSDRYSRSGQFPHDSWLLVGNEPALSRQVSEPHSIALMGLGLLGLFRVRRRTA